MIVGLFFVVWALLQVHSALSAAPCQTYTSGGAATVDNQSALQCAIDQNVASITISKSFTQTNSTIISGLNFAMTIQGSSSSIKITGNNLDPIFNITNSGGSTNSLTISSLILQNHLGVTDNVLSKTFKSTGGAIYASNSSVHINNVHFSNCTASVGGGIFGISSVVNVVNSIFSNNYGLLGAAFAVSASQFQITGSQFVSNVGLQFGAVVALSSVGVEIQGNLFRGNVAASGAGMYFHSSNSTLSDNEFIGNKALDDEGIGENFGGGGAIFDTCHVTQFTNNTFINNTGTNAAALYFSDCETVGFTGDSFVGNIASNGAGGIYVSSSEQGSYMQLKNVTFNFNSANNGGALYASNVNVFLSGTNFKDCIGTGQGGFIYGSKSSLTVSDCVFDGGVSIRGAQMYLSNSKLINISDSRFVNGKGNKYNIAFEYGTVGVIQNCLFENNFNINFGGAAYIQNFYEFSIIGSNFTKNTCSSYGGAIYVLRNVQFTIDKCMFTNNVASDVGGAIYLQEQSHFLIKNSQFLDNSAIFGGGGISANFNGTVVSSNNIFKRNSAMQGGALSITALAYTSQNDLYSSNVATSQGGALFMRASVQFTANDVDMIANTAVNGGAIYMQSYSSIQMTSCTVKSNTASFEGGAAYVFDNSSFKFTSGTIDLNTAFNGGAVSLLYLSDALVYSSYIQNCISSNSGGGFQIIESSLIVSNSTISNLRAAKSGGFVDMDNGNLTMIQCQVQLCVAITSGGAISATQSSVVTISRSKFESNGGAPNYGGSIERLLLSQADYGGVVYLFDNSHLKSTNNIYFQNRAINGGVVFVGTNSSALATKDVYTYNVALQGGCYAGALATLGILNSHFSYNQGLLFFGSVVYLTSSSIKWRGAYMSNNTATLGGTVYFSDVGGSISNSHFLYNQVYINKNTSFYHSIDEKLSELEIGGCDTVSKNSLYCGNGAAFFLSPSSGLSFVDSTKNANLSISNCDFKSNSVKYNGGAIFAFSYKFPIYVDTTTFENNTAYNCGGGINSVFTQMNIRECTFTENTAVVGGGGGIYWDTTDLDQSSDKRKVNETASIYYNNTAVYGRNRATNPVQMNVELSGRNYSSNVLSQTNEIYVTVKDHYGHVVTSDLPQLTFEIHPNSSVSLRAPNTVLRAPRGNATFAQLTIVGKPGYNAVLYFSANNPLIDPTSVSVALDLCHAGSAWNCLAYQQEECIQAECTYCRAGEYSFDINGTCSDCPAHTFCPGGDVVITNKGWYRQSQDHVEDALRCSGVGCLGGEDFATQCATGYKGPLCSVCDDGWTSTSNNQCVECSDKGQSFSTTILPILAFSFLTFLILAFAFREIVEKWLKELSLKIKSLVKSLNPKLIVKFKIIISFLQILVLSAGAFNLNYPSNYSSMLNFWTIFGFDFTKVIRCQIKTGFYFDLILSTTLPFIVLILVAAILLVRVWHAKRVNEMNPYYTVSKLKSDLLYFALLISYFTLSPTSTQIFEILQPCRHLVAGNFMIADYSVNCDTPLHKAYTIYGVVMVFVYPIGIPAVYAYFLIKYRKRINPSRNLIVSKNEMHIIAEDFIEKRKCRVRMTYPEITHITFLYDNYKARKWYFEVVDCFRRIGMASVPYLLVQGSTSQIMTVLIISLANCAALMGLRPFIDASDNNLASLSQWAISLTMLCSLALKDDSTTSDDRYQLGIVMVLINVFVLVAASYNIYKSNDETSMTDVLNLDPNKQNEDDDDEDNGNEDDKNDNGDNGGSSINSEPSKKKKKKGKKSNVFDGRNVSVSDLGGDVHNPVYSHSMDGGGHGAGALELQSVHAGNNVSASFDDTNTRQLPPSSRRNRFFAKTGSSSSTRKFSEEDGEEDSDDEV